MNARILVANTVVFALVAAFCVELAGTCPAYGRQRRGPNNVDPVVVSTPESRSERQDTHDENKSNRQQNWDNASPNQQAATYNAVKSKNSKKQAKQATAKSAFSQRSK